jgi:hypothetical protein
MKVTGTDLKPRAMSSSYAAASSSTFREVKVSPARERNSFTCSQLSHALPA